MKITPEQQWIDTYNRQKHLFVPMGNLNSYFTDAEIAGQKLDLLPMGVITVPTGDILVRDPLVYLCSPQEIVPYWQTVPTGVFPLTACVVESEEDCSRYAAIKVDFTDHVPVHYVEAMLGNENLNNFSEGNFFGFNVDAGLGTVADVQVAGIYCAFQEQWQKDNPDKNIYDNYFADIFKQSAEKNPKHQRSEGDWINWTIPGTSFQIPMFQSGFGDGAYPVYFGYDEQNQICRLIIQFIDIEMAYGDDE